VDMVAGSVWVLLVGFLLGRGDYVRSLVAGGVDENVILLGWLKRMQLWCGGWWRFVDRVVSWLLRTELWCGGCGVVEVSGSSSGCGWF
jgi:hypothetical protein